MYKQNCFKFQPIAEVWVSWDHQKVRNLWNHYADLLNMDLFYVRVKTCQTFPGVEYGLHALNLPIIISLFDRFVAKMPLVPISIDRLMLSMKSGGYAVYLPLIHTSMYGHFTGFTNNLWRSLFRKQRDSASRDIGGNRIGHVQLRPVAKSWVYPSKTSDGAPKHNRISWNLFRSPPHIEKHFFFLQISGSSGKLYGIHIQFFCIKTMVFMVFAAKPPETDGSPDPNGPSDFDRSAQRPHAPRCLRCAPDSSAMSGETAWHGDLKPFKTTGF